VETVQNVLAPLLLQVDTDVSEKYSISIFRDEGIGPVDAAVMMAAMWFDFTNGLQ
jgi:hypothetical protein